MENKKKKNRKEFAQELTTIWAK